VVSPFDYAQGALALLDHPIIQIESCGLDTLLAKNARRYSTITKTNRKSSIENRKWRVGPAGFEYHPLNGGLRPIVNRQFKIVNGKWAQQDSNTIPSMGAYDQS